MPCRDNVNKSISATLKNEFMESPEMNDKIQQSVINATAWAACDTFRGVVDPAQYKDYILVTLFLKYISDMARPL